MEAKQPMGAAVESRVSEGAKAPGGCNWLWAERVRGTGWARRRAPHLSSRLPHSAHVTFCRLGADRAAGSAVKISTKHRVCFALGVPVPPSGAGTAWG